DTADDRILRSIDDKGAKLVGDPKVIQSCVAGPKAKVPVVRGELVELLEEGVNGESANVRVESRSVHCEDERRIELRQARSERGDHARKPTHDTTKLRDDPSRILGMEEQRINLLVDERVSGEPPSSQVLGHRVMKPADSLRGDPGEQGCPQRLLYRGDRYSQS